MEVGLVVFIAIIIILLMSYRIHKLQDRIKSSDCSYGELLISHAKLHESKDNLVEHCTKMALLYNKGVFYVPRLDEIIVIEELKHMGDL